MLESELYEARNYDRGMWLLERSKLSELRQRVVHKVTGNTLEIGAGTGANIAHYRGRAGNSSCWNTCAAGHPSRDG